FDPAVIGRAVQRGLAPAPVVGGTTIGVIGRGAPRDRMAIAGLGLYGDWVRVGIGVATELPKSPLTRSRDSIMHATTALGVRPEALDSTRHVAITIVDGHSGHEEAFCIGSAAAAPQVRMIGGCVATDIHTPKKPHLWAHGEVMADAALAIVLET